MKITKFGKPALWRSIAAVSSIVLCLAVGGTAVTTEWSGYINKYLGISNTTIVQGDSDAIVPPHTVVSAAERYENARLHILPGAGHMFSGEYTETTKALIDEFLTANNC